MEQKNVTKSSKKAVHLHIGTSSKSTEFPAIMTGSSHSTNSFRRSVQDNIKGSNTLIKHGTSIGSSSQRISVATKNTVIEDGSVRSRSERASCTHYGKQVVHGNTSLNDRESKELPNNDSHIARNRRLPAPLRPDPASNSQQPKKHGSSPIRGTPECKKTCAAKSDFSKMRCMEVVNKLPELKERDKEHALEILSDELYREAFLAMNKNQKVFWLRSKLDKEKDSRSLAKGVARIST